MLWQAAQEPGAETFAAKEPGSYAFRVVAHDGAGNVGQSAQSGVTLTTAPPAPPTEPSPVPASTSEAPAGAPGLAVAPVVRIVRHPKSKIALKGSRGRKVQVRFTFVSPTRSVRFSCRLDGRTIVRCRSPFTARVGPGRHTFSVVAISPDGVRGKPVAFAFRVVREGARRR